MTITTALSGVTLTSAYSGNQSSAVEVGYGVMAILVSYTKGTEASVELKLEYSDENSATPVTWYVPTASNGTDMSEILSVSTTGDYEVSVSMITGPDAQMGPIPPGVRRLRISAKATTPGSVPGTVTVKVAHPPDYPATATPPY